ncbi:hypothetical protein [Rosistilla oblonga]|uniref:hypothetical protein n=1 Tax=Rosistilla oblonga TaxID=2527990 RepID=UPI003A96B3AE
MNTATQRALLATGMPDATTRLVYIKLAMMSDHDGMYPDDMTGEQIEEKLDLTIAEVGDEEIRELMNFAHCDHSYEVYENIGWLWSNGYVNVETSGEKHKIKMLYLPDVDPVETKYKGTNKIDYVQRWLRNSGVIGTWCDSGDTLFDFSERELICELTRVMNDNGYSELSSLHPADYADDMVRRVVRKLAKLGYVEIVGTGKFRSRAVLFRLNEVGVMTSNLLSLIPDRHFVERTLCERRMQASNAAEGADV